jgi:ABC-type transport system involved in cytochrome c biogenesis permease subunit
MAFLDWVTFHTAIFYAVGSLGTFVGLPLRQPKIQVFGRVFTWAGFALHTLLIGMIVLGQNSEELSRGYFVQLLAWTILFIYYVGWRILKSDFLGMTAAPLGLLLLILSYKVDQSQIELPGLLKELFLVLHIGPLFASLGLLTLASGAALRFLHMDRKIKAKTRLSDFDRGLPALGAYDRVNSIAVVLGFPLYTIGVLSGFIWAPIAWGRAAAIFGTWDPKEIFSLFQWFLYASVFYLRVVSGWRGRKAAIMILLIFGVSLFSFLVVNTFMPTHHSFSTAI